MFMFLNWLFLYFILNVLTKHSDSLHMLIGNFIYICCGEAKTQATFQATLRPRL